MRRIRADLWETRAYAPAPDFTTHAYLWNAPSGGNVLFFAPGTDEDFDEIAELGGVADQYLTHQDEAGPVLDLVARRFGTRLRAPALEADVIRRFAEPEVLFEHRHVDDRGVEVIPTPGHTPGSTCFLVTGAGGATYLFTGDTVFRSAAGVWTAGFIPGYSDAGPLAASLTLLSSLTPDLVIAGAGAHGLGGTRWRAHAQHALTTIPTS